MDNHGRCVAMVVHTCPYGNTLLERDHLAMRQRVSDRSGKPASDEGVRTCNGKRDPEALRRGTPKASLYMTFIIFHPHPSFNLCRNYRSYEREEKIVGRAFQDKDGGTAFHEHA